jgi:predicted metal-dependent phosphoesterase TrpH
LHVHTNRYSGCSNIDPMKAIFRAAEVGLDGIVLTEHGICWKEEDLEALRQKSRAKNVLVLTGQEVACYSPLGRFQGEFLVYGYPESLGSNKSIEIVLEMVHAVNGVVVAAHPFKKADSGDGFYGSGYTVADYKLDGLEVEHPDYDENGRRDALEYMNKMGVAGIGCSDAHDVNSIGICRTRFEETVRDVKDLCREIRTCKVQAWNYAKAGKSEVKT